MLLETLQQSTALLLIAVGLLGLLVGSFLNVVIFRLPLMMQADWRRECRQFLQLAEEDATPPFDLIRPGSRCPSCHSPIKAYQNIPVLSYLLLRGKCANCASAISARYPAIESLSGLCSLLVAWHFGYGLPMVFALILTWSLIALSFIDIDHHLLPDSITLPLIWLGMLLSLQGIYTDSQAAIIGAIAGYLSLWSIYWLFKLLTGKEGMGYGDFKLLSVFGAWLGWQYLPMIILLSSLVGAVIGVGMIALGKHTAGKPIPFGPYLAAAGWLALLWGDGLNQLYLHLAGI